ncbi:DUF443 domain-containing protein, partial [Staphylococcus epidermidis]|uniref:DUF443 domain-containing protein n=1 Tax=Staphylococcus epidermidis TaxID=1282 RepID=UPI0021AF3FA7
MDYVYTIYKNPRYNIIQKDNRYLMVDLEQNWYSYLCPMLNWFIPIKFTELTYQEFNNINIFHNGGQKSHGMMAAGVGVTISVLLRSLVGYIDINISRIWIVFMFLIGFVAVITLRLSIRKKLNHPASVSYRHLRQKKKEDLLETTTPTHTRYSLFSLSNRTRHRISTQTPANAP